MTIFTENLTVTFALFGLFLLLVGFFIISRGKITTKILVSSSMLIALTFVLSFIKIYAMPQGGSVTLVAMLPLLLIAFAYGPAVGMLAGFVYGLLHFMISPYIVHPVQVLFDYPLPYLAMGIAGYFQQYRIAGATAAMFTAFLCHVISGVVFFGSYAPAGMNPLYYSIIYNGSTLLPNLGLILLAIAVLPVGRLISILRK